MRRITELPILVKGLLVVALGVLSQIAIAGFATHGLGRVQESYRQAIDREAEAAYHLARATRYLQGIQQQALRLADHERPEDLGRIRERIGGMEGSLEEALAEVVRRKPELRAQVAEARQTVQQVRAIVAEVARATQTDRAAAETLIETRLDPVADPLSERLDQMSAAGQRAAQAAEDSATAVASSTLITILVVSTLALLAGVLCAMLLFTVGVTRPMRDLVAEVARVAKGDLDKPVEGGTRRDEIGQLARALDSFRVQGLEKRRIEVDSARERLEKDRRQQAMDMHVQDFGGSASAVMASVTGSAARMGDAATQMADLTATMRRSAEDVGQRAETSAHDLSAAAAATEQLVASIQEIARQVREATAAVAATSEEAQKGEGRMGELAGAAREIGEVVRLIEDVAGRTNLLALNATIEAARAGEAGKGFAVVAQEVKALASQTAKATADIAARIGAVQASAEATGQAIGRIGAEVGRVRHIAEAIDGAVSQQGEATREIAAKVQQVVNASQAAARAMVEVGGLADRSDAAGATVLQAARGVETEAKTLGAELDAFLTAMRDPSERRKYERIPGRGATAAVIDGATTRSGTVEDISRGGIAVRGNFDSIAVGAGLRIELPGAVGSVAARLVRHGQQGAAFAFRQDPEALAVIDRSLEWLTARAA